MRSKQNRYGIKEQCKNNFCSSPTRNHFENIHCNYDIVDVCHCGKEINYRSWEYQKYRNKMHVLAGNKKDFKPECHNCFKNELLTVPHARPL